MTVNVITPATRPGETVVSFGSGDTGGRLNARAQGRGRVGNASPNEVRAVRSQINRADGVSQRRRRQLLQEIQDNANARGNIRRGILRDILETLRDLTS